MAQSTAMSYAAGAEASGLSPPDSRPCAVHSARTAASTATGHRLRTNMVSAMRALSGQS
ncbi:hypothetical protein AB7952_00950 [Streptomyces sp. PG2]